MRHSISPTSLTLLCTYRCTAACSQCCFESNPRLRGQLDGDAMLQRISEASRDFPDLRLVVFSGGEPLLLKEDLCRAVSHCTSLGLRSRIVSNGSWAKRMERARQTCTRLHGAGLSELNLSTGRDHQAWVAQDSVINAAEAAVDTGLRVLVTIETDTAESRCLAAMRSDARVARLAENPLFGLQSNYWMPFHGGAPAREQTPDLEQLRKGCSQVFENVVVTPRDEVSACCGLTFEHIPEMRLGKCSGANLAERIANKERTSSSTGSRSMARIPSSNDCSGIARRQCSMASSINARPAPSSTRTPTFGPSSFSATQNSCRM